MALPVITVTAKYTLLDGATPARGKVVFELVSAMQDPADNVIVASTRYVAQLDSNGSLVQPLVATTSPLLDPGNVTYKVTEHIEGANDDRVYDIEIPYEAFGNTIDLADIAPAQLTPQYSYTLLSAFNAHLADPLAHGGHITPGALGGNNIWTGTNAWSNTETHSGTENHSGVVTFAGDARFKSGDPWFDVKAFGAVGDGVADDTAAIQAAINALSANGGTIFFPNGYYKCTTEINVADKRSIVFQGTGGPTGGAAGAARLSYTGSAARFIDARSSFGFAVRGMYLDIATDVNTSLIDFSHSAGGGDAEQMVVENCFLGAAVGGVASAYLLNLSLAICGNFRNNVFSGGDRGAYGGISYSNAHNFIGNQFIGQKGAPLYNPAERWLVQGNTFEAKSNGSAGAVKSTNDAAFLSFIGNWCGDANTSGFWLDLAAADSLVVQGNLFSEGQYAVACNGPYNFNGVSLLGNTFSSNASTLTAFYTLAGSFLFDYTALGNFYYQVAAKNSFNGTLESGIYQTDGTSLLTVLPGLTVSGSGGLHIGNVSFSTFAGSPENNVVANPGSYCADTTNGDGYIKATGTGNTGWKKITHA